MRIEFDGQVNPMLRLLLRGWFFTFITLGIYRFWLISDTRRYLWSHTHVAGDIFEYSGRGRELLIGFLFALAVTVPFYVLVALLSLSGPAGEAVGGLLFLLGFWCLVQFAIYRARRYRLTRTLFRGIRLGLGGSGRSYMARSVLWTLASLLTLGWAHAWRVAALERYAISNTWFGDMKAEFSGSGAGLFSRIVWLQLIALLPLQIAVAYMLATIDYSALLDAGSVMTDEQLAETLFSAPAIGALMGSVGWLVFSAILLYPAYRAIEFRWWADAIRLESMTVSSDLRVGKVYGLYLKLMLASLIFGIALSMAGGFLFAIAATAVSSEDMSRIFDEMEGSTLMSVLGAGAAILAYVIVSIGYYILYQVIVWMGFWRVAAESVQLSDTGVLERARTAQGESSALGEGIADALDFGGF